MVGYFIYVFVGLSSVLLGYFFYKVLVNHLLPAMEKKEALKQKKEMLKEAKKQRTRILEKQRKLKDESIQLLREELEEEIVLKLEDFKLQEKELESKNLQDLDLELKTKEREGALELYQAQVDTTLLDLKQRKEVISKGLDQINLKMGKIAQIDIDSAIVALKTDFIAQKQIEIIKTQKQEIEVLNSLASKGALRMLDRALSRYSPNFYWPKPMNLVEVSKKEHFEKLHSDKCNLLDELQELSGVNISLIADEDRPNDPAIKVVGGYGLAKEASRKTLEALLAEPGFSHWGKFRSVYDGHFKRLNIEAQALGRKAVDQLGLKGIHLEIQKLVGALNWRTSYRQNQWYHTVEVATLAGVLAHELGEDPEAAKRVGLLHDIGKVLDYKINAGHAVISGDYADRFGEKRYICDTVMSHHADLVLETPLAYILQTADSLSGGRPGARVNLEEGYQIRLSAIQDAVYSFQGISDVAIMNGGREVHIQVHNKRVSEKALPALAKNIAKKIEEMVNYPGKIKVMVTRTFESVKVA